MGYVKSDMNSGIKEVLIDMEETIMTKKADISVAPLASLIVDLLMMKILFHNLLSNALKYSEKDVPPMIRIYSEWDELPKERREDETSNKYCRIFIEDNGIGFEQKYSEQIFEMFKRLHNHNEYEGTGIGLALCKKIAEQHNGYI